MNEEFSQFVRYMRVSAGLSTKQLADKLGYSKSTICNYESGHKIPKETSLFELHLREVVKSEIKRKRAQGYEETCKW